MKYARAPIHGDVLLFRRRPGLYVTSDGNRAIVQTEFPGEGPRGGKVIRWELGKVERYQSGRSEIVIDAPWSHRTLKDAITELRKEYAAVEPAR